MDLISKDALYLWHPLTQHATHPYSMPVISAKGSLIRMEDDRELIDGISSWYTCIYGHCHEHIVSKVHMQMEKLDQVIFSGFTHEPAVSLAERLIKILPENQLKIFFSDNGSTAVEVGLKMALQYHHNLGGRKNVILALEEGFHGDTLGAMSVSGLSIYNGPFEDHFMEVRRIPAPREDNIEDLTRRLQKELDEDDVAAFIYEPLIQAAAGMKIMSREGLEKLLKLCKERDVLLIADEVMTGFGKTGFNFASDQLKVKPDIICLSKALTAGMLPMGATSCTLKIYEAFLGDSPARGFFHGHTYTANPLACAAALAGLDLLGSDTVQKDLSKLQEKQEKWAASFKGHPKVISGRALGAIAALDLKLEADRYGSARDKIYNFLIGQGSYLRPLGNTIYLLPPYTIEDELLDRLHQSVEELVEWV